jgi:hypothetical protein
MSHYAVEVSPRPYFAQAVVIPDSGNRTLYVKRPEVDSGYSLLLWRESWTALMQAQETARANGHATVWAGIDGDPRLAFAEAVSNLKLRFQFPNVPSAVEPFQRLITTPGLVASVQMDSSSRRFVSVRFKNVQS